MSLILPIQAAMDGEPRSLPSIAIHGDRPLFGINADGLTGSARPGNIKIKSLPTLSRGESGIIIAAPYTIDVNGKLNLHHGLDESELRRSVLYWDKIDWPSNKLFDTDTPSQYEILKSSGIFSRSEAIIHDVPNIFHGPALALQGAFDAHEKKEPGRWAVVRREDASSLVRSSNAARRSLLVHIYNAIPVPGGDTPYEDIINFRSKRRDELLILRTHISSIYRSVTQSADDSAALSSHMDEIDRATSDLLKVAREFKLKTIFSRLDVSFDLKAAAVAAASAASVGGAHILSATSALTGLTAGISVAVGAGLFRKRRGPFEYNYKVFKELPWVESD